MTVQEQYTHLEDTIRTYNPSADLDIIRSAFEFARRAHEGQKRKTGEPYIIHPLAVAQIVAGELKLDSESIEASLLHDVIEDTDSTEEEISHLFSPTIANLVEGVTKLTRMRFANKEDEQMENIRKMLFATTKDIRVLLVKISDRLHNMRTMEYQSPMKQRQKSKETIEIYAPIAYRLGIRRIKCELEDLAIKYLDPIGYAEIVSKTEDNRVRFEVMMQQTQAQIHRQLNAAGLPNQVYARMKHPYSIYRKTIMQGKTLEEIYDLYAFRVVVDTVEQCYHVLGILHDLYQPILGRFKDYIGTPKPNGYQSLHTTMVGDRGIPFEVQIRTKEMHQVAEYGVAAHWTYKLNGQGAGTEERYEWVRRLLENQEGADPEDFIRSLKVDLFDDTVFVYTPKGDVRGLPAGATPIDFAYAIHSQVGNHMTGAKVNGRMVTLDYVLKDGDFVEVQTSENAKGPSRDWMRIAKSNEAKSKIRQWFKREKREENIFHGRAAFDAELRHCSIQMEEVMEPEVLSGLLRVSHHKSLEELYAAIGYGGYSAQKAVMQIETEMKRLARLRRAEQAPEIPAEMPKPEPPQETGSRGDQGIIVEGIENCLVKLARCCTPIPGDPVRGFITRGHGVSVHRADCPNASEERRAQQPGRWIRVSWGGQPNEAYPTALEAVCRDRDNLARDITAVLFDLKTNIRGVNVQASDDGFALCHLNLRVKDKAQIDAVIRKLNQISGVLQVTRTAGGSVDGGRGGTFPKRDGRPSARRRRSGRDRSMSDWD